MLFSITLISTGLAQFVRPEWTRTSTIEEDLENYCGSAYNTWTEVADGDWYWGNDWKTKIAKGVQADGVTPGLVYPAGFKPYVLAWYSEPPICMLVPGSHDKKVEILLEAEQENANLCIHDASDGSVGTNNVGNVDNCGTGKVYACFTAATAAATRQNFGFYVHCESGCEEQDIAVWMRVRVSPMSWDVGKTGVADDLEHWCENEQGTHYQDNDDLPLMYTYPSDLVPDEPSKYPFHILHLDGSTSAYIPRPTMLVTVVTAIFSLAYMLV